MTMHDQARGLEISGDSMWSPAKVDVALAFMEQHGMNTLVFHDSDMLNKITFPEAYFKPFSSWGASPPRRGENVIYNCRAYLRSVLAKCARRGVDFFLELKEIGFPDEVLELWPEVVIDGVICPTHPKWSDFISTRYRETCEAFPQVSGFIVSVGSPEGRASLTSHRCRCERCARTEDAEWHRWIVGSISEAVRPYGKRLVIREFSYTPHDQKAVIDALTALPDGIEFCIKPYARDYYLPWPDNTALDSLTERPRWLEYDVHGQYFGWGVLPCAVIDDERLRLVAARRKGVGNVLLRTDWERINALWALDSFGKVNLATAVALHREPDADPRRVLARALKDTNVAGPELAEAEAEKLGDVFRRVYEVVLGALYTAGYVYNVSSMVPNGIRHGWWHMAEQNDLAAWDPAARGRLDVSDPRVVESLLHEKAEASGRIDAVVAELRDWERSGSLRLPDPAGVGDVIAWSERYLKTFVHTGIVVVLAAAVQAREGGVLPGGLTPAERAALERSREWLADMVASADGAADRTVHGHQADLLIGIDHVRRMLREISTL